MRMFQHLLIKSCTLMLCLASVSSYAQEQEYCPNSFDVLIRTKKSFKFEKKELKNLYCTNKFEGRDFKIVESISDEAISFDSDPELIKRAANVYYHLTTAKDFWVDSISSDYVKSLGQITVRVEITNAYSRTRHFKNAEQEENFNNAWSTPAGETPRFIKDKKQWGKEIWFSPKKIIESRKEVKSKGDNPVYQSLDLVKDPLEESTKSSLIYQGLGYLKDSEIADSDFLTTAITNVGMLAVLYGATELTKGMDKYFINKYYYVDTAMVPEIIYHEFAHIALSDTMKTVHSVPVIEGMADYFAARIQTNTILYQKLAGYSINRTKKLTNKNLYHPYLEEGWNAESDFVVSLLWKARSNFNFANQKRAKKDQRDLVDFDQLVLQAHFGLTEESDIMNDLTRQLIEACSIQCDSKRLGIDILHKTYEQKGLN